MLMESARASRRKEWGAGQTKPQHQLYDPLDTGQGHGQVDKIHKQTAWPGLLIPPLTR